MKFHLFAKRSTSAPRVVRGGTGIGRRNPALVEAVEPRRLFAASIVQDSSTVTATGTDAADTFRVEPVDADTFRVTVNALSREFDRGNVAVLQFRGLGGDDQMSAAAGTPPFVEFSMDGDAGVDTMSTVAGVSPYFYEGEIFRDATRTVAMLQGDGSLLVIGSGNADEISIFGGPDMDGEQVHITGSFHGLFGSKPYYTVNAGAGNDVMTVRGPFLKPVRFNGQDGNDNFYVEPTTTATVTGGNGNDILLVSGDSYLPLKGFDGGAGTDTITMHEQPSLNLNNYPTVENVNEARGTVTGNALNNVITGTFHPLVARGGGGNDTLRGGAANDQLFGEAGNDVIRAFGGNDKLDGGANDDLLDGGLGADEFIGGLGIDLADYSNRTENLTIGIGSYADDGAAGERDNVRTSVENVTTGSGNDTITGDGVRNVLRGNAGSDTIRGMGGNDFINPGTGADRVYGGDGNDEIYARDSIRDLVLDGGSGTDKAQRDSTDPRTSIEQTIP